MKIDIAVQTYKKPESLFYSLMSLFEVSKCHIDTVYIADDCSGIDVQNTYLNERVRSYFHPWKIMCRVNTRPARAVQTWVRGYRPKYISLRKWFSRWFRSLYRSRVIFHDIDDVHYQWAIRSTDKPYLFTLHDDIEFRDDIVGLYLSRINEKTAIVGDLGQCWRCPCGLLQPPCSASKIMNGVLPSDIWPLTLPTKGLGSRDCRINEWCSLINIGVAREMAVKERCFFGNFDDGGDIGAYWFEKIVRHGYRFEDPLPTLEQRARYYYHGWQGHSGYSVWVAQNGVKNTYKPSFVIKRTMERFGTCLIKDSNADPG